LLVYSTSLCYQIRTGLLVLMQYFGCFLALKDRDGKEIAIKIKRNETKRNKTKQNKTKQNNFLFLLKNGKT